MSTAGKRRNICQGHGRTEADASSLITTAEKKHDVSHRERITECKRKGWCCTVCSAHALIPARAAELETNRCCTCSARICCCCCLCSLRNCCFCCSITWSWALCSISICFMMAACGWFPRKGPPELVPVTTLLEPGGTEGCIGAVVRDNPTWCCSCTNTERRSRY